MTAPAVADAPTHARPRRAPAAPPLAALAGLAALLLVYQGGSHHHSAVAGRLTVGWAAGLLAGWVLMLVALMLPTTGPLLAVFARMTARKPNHKQLSALVIAGYLSVWTAFGVVAVATDELAHRLLARGSSDARSQVWIVGAVTIGVAGAYQFTELKRRCRDRCRLPLAVVTRRWRGGDERRQAWRIGLDHGRDCLGCCWSLMLVSVAVGMGNLGLMFATGAAMAAEKNLPRGRRLSTPLGLALLALAAADVIAHTAS